MSFCFQLFSFSDHPANISYSSDAINNNVFTLPTHYLSKGQLCEMELFLLFLRSSKLFIVFIFFISLNFSHRFFEFRVKFCGSFCECKKQLIENWWGNGPFLLLKLIMVIPATHFQFSTQAQLRIRCNEKVSILKPCSYYDKEAESEKMWNSFEFIRRDYEECSFNWTEEV